MKINEKEICKERLIVFGNLPYNISTEILAKWILNLDNEYIWFDTLISMFQKKLLIELCLSSIHQSMEDYQY